VLSGRLAGDHDSDVRRVWDHASPYIPLQIVQALRRIRADGLLLNTHFTTWGSNLANLGGLLTPWFARRAGFKVTTLVHHLPHTIDARRAGYHLTPFHLIGIDLACRAVAASNVVCFTLKRDIDAFANRYKPARLVQVPHGVLGPRRWRPPSGTGTVLAFGHWGRGKDPEPLLRAFLGRPERPTRLLVAGASAPTRPGFIERLADRYRSERIKFTGYVQEHRVPELFHSSDLVVLPYNENTGTSGVLYQTCQFGRVPLLRRLPVFEEMVDELGLAAHFYDTEEELGTRMRDLLADPSRLALEGHHNFEAVRSLSMDRIGPMYWRLFDERD
jgi:glycosyltransferase involved in cell wall biosynthesis